MKFVQSKSLAEYNLSMEQKLKTALQNLQKTHSDAVEKKKSVEEMKEKLDKVLIKFGFGPSLSSS